MRSVRHTGKNGRAGQAGLTVLMICFVLGAFCGSAFARMGGSAGWAQLSRCVEQYLQGDCPGFLTVLSVSLRYPLLLFLTGLTAWGLWAAPLVLAVRGFFLSYTVACFAMTYGAGGYLLGLALIFFHGLLLLPALFALGQWSMARARMRGRAGMKHKRQLSFQRQEALLCVVILTLVPASAILEIALLPALLAWVRELTGI